MSFKNATVGDPVVIVDVNHRDRHTKIERIGRKYIRVAGDNTYYDIKTGRAHDNYGHSTLFTRADFELSQAVDTARKELRDFGLEVSWRHGLSSDTILAIRAALDDLIRKGRTTRGLGT